MLRNQLRIYAVILAAIFCFACEDTNTSTLREKHARKSKGDITIVVAGSWNTLKFSSDMYDGVKMAVDEINRENTLNGRKIHLVDKQDSGDVNKARLLAAEITDNLDVMAVIGHSFSFVTSEVIDIYSAGGLITITPSVYFPVETSDRNDMHFSFTPKSKNIVEMFIRYIEKKKYKRLAIVYVNAPSSKHIVNSFYDAIDDQIKIVDSSTFNIGDTKTFGSIIDKWTHLEFDAIVYVSTSMRYLQILLPKLKENKVDVPVMVVSQPDMSILSGINKYLSDKIFFVPCNYDNKTDEFKVFIDKFNNIYNYRPTQSAINGYDAVRIIANACSTSGTVEPAKVAREISKLKDYKGLCGSYSFDDSGVLKTDELHLIKLIDGKIQQVEGF
ncbi:MAG: ABC transporter substrate-binding protein [Nitrospirae bacterium]|nr:ABC transporter substrate-binding protein [Nitrospirota bacterium]